jgi:hypothetical protein
MPFTLSHAAASLPFRRLKPVWPALVVGTFAPDLQYFIWLSDEDRSGHHFPDVVLFTLPCALLVLWLFDWIVKGPAIDLLPSAVQRRLRDKAEPLTFLGWRQFGLIVLTGPRWGSPPILFGTSSLTPYSELAMRWRLLRWVLLP